MKAPPGLSASGEVTYSTEEAQGLAALLSKTVNSDTVGLSQQQLACMRPYVKRIFDVLFPIEHSDRTSPDDGTGAQPPAPALPAGVRICPVTTDPGIYFAVSLDGTKQNLSGWFPADKCVRLANDPSIRAVYIAAVGFFDGSYSGVTQSGESVALPVCVEGTDSGGLQQYTRLGSFSLRDGRWRRKCMLKKDMMDYHRVRVGRSNEIVRVDAAG